MLIKGDSAQFGVFLFAIGHTFSFLLMEGKGTLLVKNERA